MCPDCKNLNPKDSRDGKYAGKSFYCKVRHQYIYSPCKCEQYKKADGRKKDEIAKIIDGMDKYDSMGFASAIFIIIFFIIWAIILWIKG